ncbi:hypothetical protein D8S78_02260 [Natrialba swarupiae]|nr:hypothetical protein [Natrialba swarupiae]
MPSSGTRPGSRRRDVRTSARRSTPRSVVSLAVVCGHGGPVRSLRRLERAVRLARDGRVGFVVPDSILTREQNEPIRRLIDRAPPSRIVRVGTVFEGVESGAAILVCGPDSGTVACGTRRRATNSGNGDGRRRRHGARGSRDRGDPTRDVRERIRRPVPDLPRRDDANDPRSNRGVAVARRSPRSHVGGGEQRAARLENEPTPATQPIAPGSAIVRYGLDEAELRYVDPDDLEKRADQYRSPKLVFRQTSDSLVGTYDPDGLATIKSAYTVHLRPESISETVDPVDAYKHVLGLLNSPLLNYYLRYRHTAYRSVFPQINQSTFESLPLAMGDGPDPDLVSAVDARLAATAERNAISVDLDAALGEYDDGTQLDAVPAYRVEPGVEGRCSPRRLRSDPDSGSTRSRRNVIDASAGTATWLRYRFDFGTSQRTTAPTRTGGVRDDRPSADDQVRRCRRRPRAGTRDVRPARRRGGRRVRRLQGGRDANDHALDRLNALTLPVSIRSPPISHGSSSVASGRRNWTNVSRRSTVGFTSASARSTTSQQANENAFCESVEPTPIRPADRGLGVYRPGCVGSTNGVDERNLDPIAAPFEQNRSTAVDEFDLE